MFSMDGKVALVTGGSRGIGRAVCEALAARGAHVVVNYVSDERAATETVERIASGGGRAEPMRFDVGDPDAVEEAVTRLHQRLGRLDVLVNNAGIARDALLLRVRPEDVAATWRINVQGALWCCKAAIRLMIRARRGRVVNVSSVVGETGNVGQSVYAASKAALIGLTKALAREYASRGITVNCVAPGLIETDMTAALPEEAKGAMIAQTPLGRAGKPEEVAAAVLFLASDEAGYVTGQVLRVNGGMYV
ncbi:MAG: 3-oxoacyl-[acyl-carrier-protein] reductase [Myxococcota bacterium]|nr:3-oxoacyl-[acyl-carrier-protein] reductase [Myxococcota bacterium]